ncbi:MAG: hypothetical protein U0903_21965 [Planctomycetales bacterium]
MPTRISATFFLVAAGLCLALGPLTGSVVATLLLASIAFRESVIVSVVGVNAMRLRGPLILWPLGHLSFGQQGMHSWGNGVLEASVGPIVNLVLAFFAFTLTSANHLPDIWGFGTFPAVHWDHPLTDAAALMCAINCKILVLNILPARSLDAGRALESYLAANWGTTRGWEWSLKTSAVTAFLAAIAAYSMGWNWIVALSFYLLLLTFVEAERFQVREEKSEDTFLGYDFSAGYTSLEKTGPVATQNAPPQPGFLKRWLERRRLERLKQQEEQLKTIELELDGILAKLHVDGMQSLSDAEKRLLNQASARLREKGKSKSPGT